MLGSVFVSAVLQAVDFDRLMAKDKSQQKPPKRERFPPRDDEISDPADAPEGEEDLSPEERRVLERKMKKIRKKEEKKRLKAEGISSPKNEESGPTASQQALDYLSCWAHNRAGWKFQKTRQTWLLQNMFDSEQIQDEKFSALLQYLEGLRGGSRDTTVQKALVVVQESGRAPEDGDVQKRARRAREVIQMLS
ncbi:uncharacterized protein C7orf50 homolog isoform X3 [Phyllopteryx taeniolatus]|uniref:uncharacterized protein C7orf50 homolog isoform X3 n=1 Tax=Phyllopteryx taeniolatus TaxID=161469 RepID=UPI002AD3CFCD|nr:uncharacterized protein C7orf50 homolog isoform X3 [Phyllopteryx taeniolatus]